MKNLYITIFTFSLLPYAGAGEKADKETASSKTRDVYLAEEDNYPFFRRKCKYNEG